LIEISKQEIYEFLESINKTYVMDSTNNENIYLRNSIRNNLIPLIEENYNPKIKESLIRLSNIIKDEDEWMEKETNVSFTKVFESISPDDVNPDTIQLSLKLFINYHLALQKRIIRKAIKIINRYLKKITLNHIEDAIKLLISKSSGKSIDLPDQIRIYKHNKSFFVKKESVPLRELGEKRKNIRKTC
jgi:tRNA(Ile)-lysidine synthase